MKETPLRIIIPVLVFIVLMAVVAVIISTTFKTPLAPDSTRGVIPQPPPSSLLAISIPKAPCLATSTGFTELRACTKQSDCASCTESPTSCVMVGGNKGVAADGTLSYPVDVNVALPLSGEECSGHGTRDPTSGKCVCDGEWSNGGCVADVCYTGDNCDVGVFRVGKAGQYCLPSYLGKCDEFTSDTVLTNTGAGTTWSCQCKQSMAGLFVQNVEGGNCNVQVACGAPVGVAAQVNVGSDTEPVFEERVVYPNRLTSYLDEKRGQELCVYKTEEAQLFSHDVWRITRIDTDPPRPVTLSDDDPDRKSLFEFNVDNLGGGAYRMTSTLKRLGGEPYFILDVTPRTGEMLNVHVIGTLGFTRLGGYDDTYTTRAGDFDIYSPTGELPDEMEFIIGDGVPFTLFMARISTGPNVARPMSRIVKGAAADADPTCAPQLYSNKCTINAGGGNLQVIRGTGLPGDPHETRVSPPFYAPVPPGLNRCPDGWSGRGTRYEPCVSPVTSTSYAFFTKEGGWLGPTITSVAELSNWWTQNVNQLHPSERMWTTLGSGDVFCLESGTLSYSGANASNADSMFCVKGTDCSAADGYRAFEWSGARDGPLLDNDALPHWVSGGPYGGQCTCDGSYQGGYGNVAQYQLTDSETPDNWWSCGPDMCPGSQFPSAYWNKATRKCECNTTPLKSLKPPFTTGMHYKHPTTPAVCVRDPCNPSGVNMGVNEVSCTVDEQCGGVCSNNQCYIPFADGKTCDSDLQCTGEVTGLSNRVTKCVNGTCATLDVVRERMGSTCTKDSHCSLGACTGPTGAKTCTGGCACSSGYHQESDNGISPLGFTCVDDCVGKCFNDGICVHLPEEEGGGTECRCTPYFGGEQCEIKLCSRYMEYCDADTPCCSYCPCNDATSHCCNRFPAEPTPEGKRIACVNNTCAFTCNDCESYPAINCKDCTEWSEVYTSTPPDCNGYGQRDDNNKCVCVQSHTGDECEIQVCSFEQQLCDTDKDCCNNCVCDDGTSREECCGPFRDQYLPFTRCQRSGQNSICVRL